MAALPTDITTSYAHCPVNVRLRFIEPNPDISQVCSAGATKPSWRNPHCATNLMLRLQRPHTSQQLGRLPGRQRYPQAAQRWRVCHAEPDVTRQPCESLRCEKRAKHPCLDINSKVARAQPQQPFLHYAQCERSYSGNNHLGGLVANCVCGFPTQRQAARLKVHCAVRYPCGCNTACPRWRSGASI